MSDFDNSGDPDSDQEEQPLLGGLILQRRFLAYFVTQFLGAFNDNAFRFAFVMLVTYRIGDDLPMDSRMLVTLASGLFILPFFLFSAFSGQLADRYSKRAMIRILKVSELFLMVVAVVGFLTTNAVLLLVLVFLMGSQSACFGPLKYSIIPEILSRREILPANAWTQGGTFFAIILGTLFGSALIGVDGGVYLICGLVVAAAVGGLIASWFLPRTPPSAPELRTDWNFFRQTWRVLSIAFHDRFVLICILGISWFWFIGASLLAQFPVLAESYLHAAEGVASLLLVLMSVGVAIGAFLSAKLLKGRPDPRFVPFATLVMTVFLVDVIATTAGVRKPDELFSLGEFMSVPGGLRVLVGVFFLSVAGGFYTTPLYSLIQTLAEERRRARTIAATNLMNSAFMVFSAVLFIVLYGREWTLLEIFGMIAVFNLLFAGLLFVCAAMARTRLGPEMRRTFFSDDSP